MPVVLITNDPKDTWYEGLKGRVFPIVSTENSHYVVPKENVPCSLRIGRYGVDLADGVLLYTQSEYNEVVRQRDKMIGDLAKHAQTIVDMQNEKLRLQAEVDQERKGRIVELPRGVAETLRYLGFDYSRADIISIATRTGGGLSQATRSLQKVPFDTLLTALVNGYTVEQSPEERLNNEIEGIILDWHEAPSGEVSVLTKRIVDHLKSIQT